MGLGFGCVKVKTALRVPPPLHIFTCLPSLIHIPSHPLGPPPARSGGGAAPPQPSCCQVSRAGGAGYDDMCICVDMGIYGDINRGGDGDGHTYIYLYMYTNVCTTHVYMGMSDINKRLFLASMYAQPPPPPQKKQPPKPPTHQHTGTHIPTALPALGTAILNEDNSRPARLRGIAVATLSALLANERVRACVCVVSRWSWDGIACMNILY